LRGVRSPQRKRRPDPVGADPQKPPSLRGIANKARVDQPHRLRDRYRCLKAERLLTCGHDLNQAAASGGDQVTAQAEALNLHGHSEAVAQRLRAKRYRAKGGRRWDMPQANGKERPLGIPALADKRVHRAGAPLFTALDEQALRECRDGYRPGRGAVEAVRDLTCDRPYGGYGYGVEGDVKGGVDHVDHPWLVAMRRVRSEDRACLQRIQTGRQAGG
jgi:RNA-directed DNA polymerase